MQIIAHVRIVNLRLPLVSPPLHKCSRRSGRVNFWWPLKTLNGLFRGKTWGDYLKSWRLIGGRETWDWNDGAVKFVANMKSGIKRYLTLNNKEKTFQIYNGWRKQGWGRRKRSTPWRRWRTSQTAKAQHWQVFFNINGYVKSILKVDDMMRKSATLTPGLPVSWGIDKGYPGLFFVVFARIPSICFCSGRIFTSWWLWYD